MSTQDNLTPQVQSNDITQPASDRPRPDQRRRQRRTPPASLPDHFSRKGYLSVSDLVGPSWCEYNYQYGILSLSHLPPSQRPSTITTAEGATLAASADLVEQKDKTLTAGKAVHAVLEKQVAQVQVYVETETREDTWALRLLNVWCDVMALSKLEPGAGGKGKEVKCVREVPVYGWISGVFVMGVVDEIEKRMFEVGGGGGEAEGRKGREGKTWASQEEWKKDQLRKQVASPKKCGKANGSDAKKRATRPLTSFFGSSHPQEDQKEPEKEPEVKQGWAYFLSDTKTRISSWVPAEEDQFSARMQCMTYKRLFDGLCLGALSSSLAPSSSSSSRPDSSTDYRSTFNSNATPMDWTSTFVSLELDPHRPLSSVFLRDAMPLCESWGTDLDLWVAENDADVCTLDHIRLLLEYGLRVLVADARRGQLLGEDGEEEEGGKGVGVIQDRLALTYRRQSHRRRRKRKKAASIYSNTNGDGLRQATLDATREGGEVSTTAAAAEDPVEPAPPPPPETDTRKSIDALEGRNDASAAIEQALSSPPPCTPKKPSSPSSQRFTSPTSPTPTKPESEGGEDKGEKTDIIGIVTFPYDAKALDAYLGKMIAMWKGERALRGVSVDQTRRCWTCEWMEACEWRTSQSSLHRSNVRQKSSAEIEVTPTATAPADAPGAKQGEAEGAEEADEDFWSTLDLNSITVKDSAGNVLDW